MLFLLNLCHCLDLISLPSLTIPGLQRHRYDLLISKLKTPAGERLCCQHWNDRLIPSIHPPRVSWGSSDLDYSSLVILTILPCSPTSIVSQCGVFCLRVPQCNEKSLGPQRRHSPGARARNGYDFCPTRLCELHCTRLRGTSACEQPFSCACPFQLIGVLWLMARRSVWETEPETSEPSA